MTCTTTITLRPITMAQGRIDLRKMPIKILAVEFPLLFCFEEIGIF